MSRPSFPHIPFLLLLTFSFCTGRAQQTFNRSFKIEENSLAVKINTLYRNRQGYILAGTTNGLYKFDGLRFSRIPFTNKDYNDTVTAIFQDRQQLTWVGFQSGRIAHVRNNRLQYYDPEEGTPRQKITAFAQDSSGKIWFAAYGEGIYFIRDKKVYLVNADDGLSDLNVNALVATPNGDMLAATDQGINICNVNGPRKKVTVIGPKQGLPDYMVTSIQPSGNDQYYIGLQDKGFCLYDHRTNKVIVPPMNWQGGEVTDIMPTQRGAWIATAEHGLYRFTTGSAQLSATGIDPGFQHINKLLRDLQGNIWLSSPEAGLSKTAANSINLLPLYAPDFFEKIHCILWDRDSSVWINDDDQHGLICHRRVNGVYVPSNIPLRGLPPGNTDISTLYQDGTGKIWVGTMGSGLFLIDPTTGLQRQVKECSLKNILSISGDSAAVFISSLEGAAFTAPHREWAGSYHFDNFETVSTGSHYIYAIYRDHRGRTWFATDGRGIFMQEKGAFTFFNEHPNTREEHVYAIAEDKLGNIWFSTAADGLLKYNGRQFINYGLGAGLSNLYISSIRADGNGNIVIVHKKGLDVLDPVTDQVYYVNSNAGIASVNTRDLGAITQDAAGNVLVSTIDGILLYHKPNNSVQQPTTILESVQLFLNEIDTSQGHSFAHDENNFSFTYSGLYYTDPQQVFYQYKLDGLDTSWVVTQDRTKTFPRLEPGTYTFRIRSSLNRNFTHASEASYHFTIRQAFYKTLWFIGACLLLLAGLIYAYVRNRERSLKNIQRLKEEKIQFQFEVLRNQVNPHFLFNSFNTLISAIEEDPKMAVQYVEHLSDFFRNIVSHRDKDVISLREEIALLNTYFFLQQKRYGDHIGLQLDIPEQLLDSSFIPPLTLQLLVENAIKHNVVSKEKPLHIVLSTRNDDQLLVSNNRNIRKSVQPGAGMGLQNIMNRYQLLTSREVLVESHTENFIVSLPLIKS